MSRYVDISELEIPEDDCCYADLESFVETICESEYIDIVRCRECTERDDDWCMYFGKMINPDDFCSYGERDSEKPNNSKERSSE